MALIGFCKAIKTATAQEASCFCDDHAFVMIKYMARWRLSRMQKKVLLVLDGNSDEDAE